MFRNQQQQNNSFSSLYIATTIIATLMSLIVNIQIFVSRYYLKRRETDIGIDNSTGTCSDQFGSAASSLGPAIPPNPNAIAACRPVAKYLPNEECFNVWDVNSFDACDKNFPVTHGSDTDGPISYSSAAAITLILYLLLLAVYRYRESQKTAGILATIFLGIYTLLPVIATEWTSMWCDLYATFDACVHTCAKIITGSSMYEDISAPDLVCPYIAKNPMIASLAATGIVILPELAAQGFEDCNPFVICHYLSNKLKSALNCFRRMSATEHTPLMINRPN